MAPAAHGPECHLGPFCHTKISSEEKTRHPARIQADEPSAPKGLFFLVFPLLGSKI